VNAVAVIYVNQHLESLRTENQRNRMASGLAKRSLRSRISTAAAGLGIITANTDAVVPRLSNYPYGG
jgi:ribosomal protein L32E